MKFLIQFFLLGLMISSSAGSAFAGPVSNPGAQPTLTVGGRVFTDLSNLIVLHSKAGNVATNVYGTMRKSTASAGYAVTSAKTLRIFAVRVSNGSPGGSFAVCYGDNDVGADTTTVPTNIVRPGFGGQTLGLQANSTQEYALDFRVPAGKYPCVQTDGTVVAHFATFYGYEE